MNESNFTSKELSKWLKDNGCRLDNDYYWMRPSKHWHLFSKSALPLYSLMKAEIYPAYDILNDICIRYAPQFFGTKTIEGQCCKKPYYEEADILHSRFVLMLVQKWGWGEVEKYIKEHCLFNPENREEE